MKMAKASEADLAMAFDLSRIIEDIESGYCPLQAMEDTESEDIEWLDTTDANQMGRLIDLIKSTARKGSIFRVTFGMAVVCDKRNELLDPDADTLEAHPKFLQMSDDIPRLQGEARVMLDLLSEALGVIDTIEPECATAQEQLDALKDNIRAVLVAKTGRPS